MESPQKKRVSGLIIVLFGMLLTIEAAFANGLFFSQKAADGKTEETQLIFWYTGEENREFFETCANDFQKETGIAVTPFEQQSLNYFAGIYQATLDGEAFPDVYLLEGDELEKAYFAQMVQENQYLDNYKEGYLKNAIAASTYQDKLLGYPLYFQTYVFAFRNGYFETAPASIQEMLAYSVDHDPGEGVEKLFEWNLTDGYYNFAFFGAAEEFVENEPGILVTNRNDEVFQACTEIFGLLSDNIELKPEELSKESILKDFVNGKTIAVLLDTDSIQAVKEVDCTIVPLPAVKEDLPMRAVAETVMLCVNGFSEQTEEAAEFADFVASKKMDKLVGMTGHMPADAVSYALESTLFMSEARKTAQQQYENALLLPNTLNAADYWVKFQNTVLEIWNGTEL